MIIFLLACTISSPLPDIGDCAEYPDEVYDYGQIGIGTCIAGASDLQFRSTASEDYLLISNSNPYLLFSGGSLLSVAWSSIDLSKPLNYTNDLQSVALPTPSFNGDMVVTEEDIGLLTVRFSEDSRTQVDQDYVHFIDLSDPSIPTAANIGLEGSDRLMVEADPVAIVYAEETGFAYVGNRSTHDISLVNTQGDYISIVAPWPFSSLRDADFFDADQSGSKASLIDLEDLVSFYADDSDVDGANLTDDVWSFDWVEGSWRLWLPEGDDYQRFETVGNHNYTRRAIGQEFASLDANIETPFLLDSRMFASVEGTLGYASWNAPSNSWLWEVQNYFSIEGAYLNSPTWLVQDEELSLLFTAEDDQGFWIGQAGFDIGGNLKFESSVITATEGERVSEPFVFKEDLASQWRLFYSVFDGTQWSIASKYSLDTEEWIDASGFSLDGKDVAAPVLSEEADRIRMWYAVGENDVWDIGYAESLDGENWKDFGVVIPLGLESTEPPRAALQAYPTSAFSLEGESAGYVSLLENNSSFFMEENGWKATILAGQTFDTDLFGADSAGGLEFSSFIESNGTPVEYFFSMTNATGTKQIGYADPFGENADILISPPEGIDSVFQPVIWDDNGSYTMFFAQQIGDEITIRKASSSDFLNWTVEIPIPDLELGTDFDSTAMVPSSVYQDNAGLHLIYSGFDGNSWRIGKADSADNGDTWTRSNEPFFGLGKAGDWDDSMVKDGFVIKENGLTQLWYSGFDGSTWNIGYATLENGEWSSEQTSLSQTGMFYNSGATHPVVWQQNGQTELYYTGLQAETTRVGKAIGSSPAHIRQVYSAPTLGDSLILETHRSDADSQSIPAFTRYGEEANTVGVGLTAITIDQDRGFLYVATQQSSYLEVFDIRDDSQGEFIDRNYLDVETKIFLPTSIGSSGFRQIIPHPDGQHLLALSSSPEAVFIVDMDEVVDNEYVENTRDIQSGYLSLPAVTSSQDEGERTRAMIGSGKMLLHPDQRRLFVSNFNTNSISIFDLSLSTYGREIAEVQAGGENPYAMTFSPDGNSLIVSNYTGDTDHREDSDGNTSNTTLSIFDINPESETIYTLLTQVVNK